MVSPQDSLKARASYCRPDPYALSQAFPDKILNTAENAVKPYPTRLWVDIEKTLKEKIEMPTKYADTDYTQFFTAATKPVLTGFSIDKKTGDVSAIFNNTVCICLDSDRITSLQAEALLNTPLEKPKHMPSGAYQKFLKAWAKFRRKLSTFKKIYKGKPFDRIVFSGPCTILTGDHNEKTIVRCGDTEIYDPEKAVLSALFIREYGKPAFTFLMEFVNEEYKKNYAFILERMKAEESTDGSSGD